MAELPCQLTGDDVPPLLLRRGNAISRWAGRTLLRILGWRMLGELPNANKVLFIAAPHSHLLDAIAGYGAMNMFSLRVSFMIKDSLFKGPLGWLLRWLGAHPIDRAESGGVVEQTIAAYNNSEKMLTLITPEGTRMASPRWKSGFYHVAMQTGAVLVPVVINHAHRSITVAQPFQPSGDYQADLPRLLECFREGVPCDWQRLSKPMAQMLGREWPGDAPKAR